MTKVIILGQEPKEEKKLKPIEFVKCLKSNCTDFNFDISKPKSYDTIELICRDYGHLYDLMYAYNTFKGRDFGCLYLGHFNDGVVE